MAGRGRRFSFHGAFGSKAAARAKERAVGGFIKPTTIRGQRRFVVMSRNAEPSAELIKSCELTPYHRPECASVLARAGRQQYAAGKRYRRGKKLLYDVTRTPRPMREGRRPEFARKLTAREGFGDYVPLSERGDDTRLAELSGQSNPRPVEVYRRVLRIEAVKGRGRYTGQRFYHPFKVPARIYGLSNGDLLVTTRRL